MNLMEEAVLASRLLDVINVDRKRSTVASGDGRRRVLGLHEVLVDDRQGIGVDLWNTGISVNALDEICQCVLDSGFQVEWMSLINNELEELPESICRLTSLQNLGLSDNRLTGLPASLSNLRLNKISIAHNRFSEIPPQVLGLRTIKRLHCGFNWIASVPDDLDAWANLVDLSLAHNVIARLPESVGHLPALARLDLSGNRGLAELPGALLRRMETGALAVSGDVVNGIDRATHRWRR